MKKKRFKHKWWHHLFTKYKVVETENAYHEYERCRNWFIIFIYLLAIVFSPIIIIIVGFKTLKSDFHFPDGKNGRNEEYTIYMKENSKDYEK